jgi:hypothetical protein
MAGSQLVVLNAKDRSGIICLQKGTPVFLTGVPKMLIHGGIKKGVFLPFSLYNSRVYETNQSRDN